MVYCASDGDAGIRLVKVNGTKSETIARLAVRLPPTTTNIDLTQDGHSLLLTVVDHSSSNIYRRIAGLE